MLTQEGLCKCWSIVGNGVLKLSCKNIETLQYGTNSTYDAVIEAVLNNIPIDVALQVLLFDSSYYFMRIRQIPISIARFSNMVELIIDDNIYISELSPALQKLSCIQTLSITNTPLLVQLPAWIGNMKSLTDITVHNNGLRRLPPTLKNLPNLNVFDCAKNHRLPTVIWGFAYAIHRLVKKNLPHNALSVMTRHFVHEMVCKRYTYGGARAAALATIGYLGKVYGPELRPILRWHIGLMLWASREDDCWRDADELEYQKRAK